MRPINMAVSVEDQFAAVFVPLPFSNHLHIQAALDRARDEQATQRTLTEVRIAQTSARACEGFFCVRNPEYLFIVRLTCAQPL